MADMENNTAHPAEQQSKEFVCSGDCLKCSRQQWLYCSAQHGRQVFRMMDVIFTRFDAIEKAVGDMRQRIEAMQSADSEVFNPLTEENTTAEKPLV